MEKGGLRKHYLDRKIVIKKKDRKVKNKMSNFKVGNIEKGGMMLYGWGLSLIHI